VDIRDLARHLNLSIGTVSRALNGRRYVDPETRKRVLKAAADLGYAPNQWGRSLRQGTTGMVAMMLPTSGRFAVADTIFVVVLDGLRSVIAARKLDLLVLLCDPDDADFAYLRRVGERRLADGFVIADMQRIDRRIDYLLDREVPFVAFGRSRTPGAYSWIDLDFEGVAEAAVERLTGLGHRRIACVTTSDEINYGFVFADAYRAALERRRIAGDPDLIVRVEASEAGGYAFGERFLAMHRRPTAAILANEAMVVGLYSRLFAAGLTPGRDLSIIGFGEEPVARFLRPEVTHYRSDLRGLGARLGDALLSSIPAYSQGEGTTLVQEVWPMELVPGESDGVALAATT
jgi:DNA-binding LacI/PurR family transcriptional regulator